MDFNGFGAIAAHFAGLAAAAGEHAQHGLEKGAQLLEREAKAEFGEYQEGAGGLPSWEPLAESTQADRVAQGYPADEPLLRDGTLRDSITTEIGHHEAVIGSTDPVMAYQEFGTARVPPRSVLGIALYRHIDEVVKLVGEGATAEIRGGR